MKRKLYIHAGPPKTGTSALQYVLRDHDGSAVYYPKAGQWDDGSHHNLVLNFYGDDGQSQWVREDIDQSSSVRKCCRAVALPANSSRR